ncbi:hypothetical protein [Rivularia sp. UHCC 0363]|uniref:hypothetical protein n=1 Tax=Rivularia sp. UHCC 0363 TaxID=3110244 RepID=UPI002B2121BE|nr:hypothetical protein [Rivularia sp. UHCC 0363]MEA5597031.1 hypothetical protein [Rivularia sp. UHCC 0363]
MKKSIFTTALLITSLLMVGCNNLKAENSDTSNSVQADNSEVVSVNKDKIDNSSSINDKEDSNTTEKAPVKNVSTNLKAGEGQPKFATIREIVQGDLKCYVTLIDEQDKEQTIGASFEICAQEKEFINKKVKLSYDILNFNDCESNEPCGKTKKESAIVKMEVVDGSKSGKSSGDTRTLSNGEWTIKLSNYDSWDGVNNTGNVKYYGCDSKGKCIELTGGKVSCRNGKCVTGWKNGNYVYALENAITEDGNDSQGSTLIVRQGNKVILRAEGLKQV